MKILLTSKQVNGTKLEIWTEQLLLAQGYQYVRRDVHYFNGYDAYRQVDVEYKFIDKAKICHAIIEAKFSSGKKIPYLLRTGSKNKLGLVRSPLRSLVDEVLERKEFVGADIAFLLSNYFFEDKTKIAAKKNGIIVIEKPLLEQLYVQAGGRLSLAQSIQNIKLDHYSLQKHVEILR